MNRIIDAHHHLWKYEHSQYSWIGQDMAALRRDFLMEDFHEASRDIGPVESVVVQARQSVEETQWLIDVAREHASIAGIVGWLPIASGDFDAYLQRFAGDARLVGLRHVIQDEPDMDFMLGRDFNRGIERLKEHQLVYDILVRENQLPATIEFVSAHPGQSFVLDHIGKPDIRGGSFKKWATSMEKIAGFPSVCCKLSGLVTEANWNSWSIEDLKPYVRALLEMFGPRRLMFGSDWPVCLVASSYRRWFSVIQELLVELPDDEQNLIFSGTACSIYLGERV